MRPLGFSLDDRHLRRAGLDYWPLVRIVVHADWTHFCAAMQGRRLVAFTTRGTVRLWDFAFRPHDVLVFGPETTGLSEAERKATQVQVRIPMRADAPVRSLNLATAAGIAAMEALRQLAPTTLR